MDAVTPEPAGTWKTSMRCKIRVQNLEARSDCTPAGRCCWRSVTSQATPPKCRKMLWNTPLASSMVPGVARRQVRCLPEKQTPLSWSGGCSM